MPYSPTHRIIYGEDARCPKLWANQQFRDWLAAKLNEQDGPYASALGVTLGRQVVVTDNPQVAQALYSEEDSPPVVLVENGPAELSNTGRNIGNTFYEGTRGSFTLLLDMGVKDADPNNNNVVVEQGADELLANFVLDAINRGLGELDNLGLFSSDVRPDTERARAGRGRNPHTLTFFCLALHDYQPTG